jgi:hypothetical protein
MVQKFKQHSCNTSTTRRGARGSVLGFWAFAGQPFPPGRGGRYLSLPLMVSLAVKMIDEVG